MVEFFETLTDNDFKKDILSYISKSKTVLNSLENSLKKSDAKKLCDIMPQMRDIYGDIIYLYVIYLLRYKK